MVRRLALAVVLAASIHAHADAPRAVVIETDIAFTPFGQGVFTASAPLCASGTVSTLSLVTNPSRAHGWTARVEFACDDGSGKFNLQYHPQFHAGTPFTVSGPWTVWGAGTGRYEKLTGHGDFGVVIDFSVSPWTAEEIFTGMVQLD